MPPPLVQYGQPSDYRDHYMRNYCRGIVHTFDGIRVFFREARFDHAFYISSRWNGPKDVFCQERAERIDWIGFTLGAPSAKLYQGWNQKLQCVEPDRRVAVVIDDYVVIIRMGLTRENVLRADFVTAFCADRSLAKIVSAPAWDRAVCLEELERRKGR